MKRIFPMILLAAILLGVGVAPTQSKEAADKNVSLSTIELSKTKIADLKARFAKFYEPVKVASEAKIKPYELPLDLTKVANWAAVSKKLNLGSGKDLLVKNGFVVIPWRNTEKITAPYKTLKQREIPIFVTSDTLLHLYHIQFDETLKDIEEREFYPDLVKLSRAMYDTSRERYKAFSKSNGAADALIAEAWKRNAIYFAVALSVLEENRVITPESLVKMSGEERDEFLREYGKSLQKNPEASRDKEFRRATERLMFHNDKSIKNAKIVLKYYMALPKTPVTKFPGWVNEVVKKERELIKEHKGFDTSPLFIYMEDYSQYVPRGHYTRSFILKKYFKAMMWYGRLTFVIKPKIIQRKTEAEKKYEAKIQTLQAALIAAAVTKVRVGDKTVLDLWDRLYGVTAYYVGVADDLTLYEYRNEMCDVYGSKFSATSLLKPKKWFEFRKKLALLRPPAIYSGTGNIEGPPAAVATEKDLEKALEDTKGLRFMGQRYIPDSYMMGRLVYPTVGPFKGKKFAFTTVQSDGGIIRGFPRGLDVMAILGSERAMEILKAEGDTNYERYDETFKKLCDEFAEFDEKDWNRNLYWSWLYSLKALLKPAGKGTQTFMQTEAWTDKQLNASLASWAELRHDTILYAKQSYTMVCGSAPVRPKPVVGYVEPVPEFYGRLLAISRMTSKGLAEMKVLDKKAAARLQALEEILKQLIAISEKELANKPLTEKEYSFIRNFGKNLEGVIAGVSEVGEKTTMIADVHTDCNSRQCLEEGVGYVKLMVVAYALPDGRILIGAGPVMSYYEFKHPMGDRLTDEKWREMLKGGKAPEQPEWTKSINSK